MYIMYLHEVNAFVKKKDFFFLHTINSDFEQFSRFFFLADALQKEKSLVLGKICRFCHCDSLITHIDSL